MKRADVFHFGQQDRPVLVFSSTLILTSSGCAADLSRKALTGNDLVEHLAERDAVDCTRPHPKTNSSSRKLIHHDEDPMCLAELDSTRNKSKFQKLVLDSV